ncbi:MAG: hypothetical protein ACHQ1H_13415 [Nitrososphaerales archaeon]
MRVQPDRSGGIVGFFGLHLNPDAIHSSVKQIVERIILWRDEDYFLFIPTMIIAIPAMAIATISPITGPK